MSFLRKMEWSRLELVDYKSRNKKKDKIVWLNIVIPILVGAVTYYCISPEVLFVTWIKQVIDVDDVFRTTLIYDVCVARFIRNHLLDMLWGYALVFSLFKISGNDTASIRRSFWLAFSFSAIMEILQLMPNSNATFDILDIIFEFVAEVIAVVIIKNTFKERKVT